MKLEIAPFVNAMNHTFKEMAGVELVNGSEEPFEEKLIQADASAIISLRSDENASIVLTVSEVAARTLTTKISRPNTIINERRMTDTLGELLNMLVGDAQRRSTSKFSFSIPVSIFGKNHEVNLIAQAGRQVICRRVVSRMMGENVVLYLANAQVLSHPASEPPHP